MWRLRPTDLSQFKGAGGERFVEFVDRLILAAAWRGGLPDSEIQTQLRANIKDGGVDTEVRATIPGDQSGWFDVPTIWQYKAVDARSIDDRPKKTKRNDLQKEIHKPHVVKRISKGYGYRFCLLGDLSSPKVESWESQLKVEADRINAKAPSPRVVHGGHLRVWAERFPAVIAWLRGGQQHGLHLEAWARSCRAVTPHYVVNPEWEHVRQQIRQHVDFSRPCGGGEPCLTVGGAAGVGKTRLVCETLNELIGAATLVIYASDERDAQSIAIALANTPGQTVILVADETAAEARYRLNDVLRGHVDRARVVCLDNAGGRLASRASQLWLAPDELKNTAAIIEKNFAGVPGDRRHQYAALSRGFVRLAADMCLHDAELARGDLAGLLDTVEGYARRRLRREHLPLVSLLALFHKVGFRDDVRAELDALCSLAQRSQQDFRDAVHVVRDSPGFVVQAGRFWYVTPEIVARVLFAEGWQSWVGDDVGAFLQRLPETLQRQFIDRAGRLGGEEVRDRIASFFREWFDQLSGRDLQAPQVASLVEAVVEAAPEENLPRLRTVLEHAGPAELEQIASNARRTLVWLLERLVSLPEFFDDCEACLFQLALNETEPRVANNATGIWTGLFGVYLSGTAAPFDDRMEILRARTGSSNPKMMRLAFEGVRASLDTVDGRVVGPPVVARRMRPRDWQPGSAEQELACYRAVLTLCQEHITGASVEHRRLAFDVLVDRVGFLLRGGLLADLQGVLRPGILNEQESRRVLHAVDEFLDHEEQRTAGAPGRDMATRCLAKVRDWINTFRPSDFDGHLRSVCSRDPWDHRFARAFPPPTDETDELAEQIVSDPARLNPHLEWLAGPEARSAERLGFALGWRDATFTCARMVFQHAISHGTASLLRGYVRGVASANRLPTAEVLSLVDDLETSRPAVAVDVSVYAGDAFDALKRATRLVETGAISPTLLRPFAMGSGRRALTAPEAVHILSLFVGAADSGDAESAESGIRFLCETLHFHEREGKPSLLGDSGVRALAQELAEAALPHAGRRVEHEWSFIVEQLSRHDAQWAIALFGRALSQDGGVSREAEERLQSMIEKHPEAVMRAVGKSLLDSENGWRLQVSVLRELVGEIPTRCVMNWLKKHGLEAARAMARHLPKPYVDDAGRAVVPPMLDQVLREYDDDEVFERFLSGAHSGETWWGNAADRMRREAAEARKFLSHPNRRVREWAKHEVAERMRRAEEEDRIHAESSLPS